MTGDALGQPGEARTAGDERKPHEVPSADQEPAGADTEEDDQDQWDPEARRARRRGRDREREESDRVDQAERDDRESDRLEPELDAAHLAQRADLDEIVE